MLFNIMESSKNCKENVLRNDYNDTNSPISKVVSCVKNKKRKGIR